MSNSLEENAQVCFPDDVLGTGSDAGVWWVAHTKSRRERALASLLVKERIGCFLPLWEKRYRSHSRHRLSTIPLFPGYVFFKGSRLDRYQALKTGHIANVLEVIDQDQLVGELLQIQVAMSLNASLDPFPFVREGTRVQIVEGPFTGLEGIIQRRKKVDRLILSVDIIHQAVALEIRADWVEPSC
jgi:transcription antitermination factor NusG